MSYLSSHNDENELLERVAHGDHSAFSVLYSNHRDRVYAAAFKLTRSGSIAEEVVQEVFLQLWLKRARLGEVGYFRSYLFVTTRNHVFNALKRLAYQHRLIRSLSSGNPGERETFSDSIVEKEYEGLLRQAVGQLPPQQQQVYRLIKEQGLKRQEVAGYLQISPETVKQHLAQAMRSVRAYCLEKSGLPVLILMYILSKK